MSDKNIERVLTPGTVSAGLILAAGFSERMGTPKALLMWDRSMTFLKKIILEFLSAGCDPVVCTVNSLVLPHCSSLESIPRVKIILNEHPEWGRMHSVRLGLEHAGGRPYCLLHNVDNPFIHETILRKILDSANPGSWCAPEYKGKGGHPVLLTARIMDHILQSTCLPTTLEEVLGSFPKKTVKMEDDLILRNINTPGDYRKYRRYCDDGGNPWQQTKQ